VLIKKVSSNEELQARKEKLKSIGFESLSHTESSIMPRLEMASMWPELRGSEFTLWKKFLPTVRKIRDFQFNSVPDEALDAIQLAKEANCFDDIVIWTPEDNKLMGRAARAMDSALEKLDEVMSKTDPMAVGVLTDAVGKMHFYSIARWGESLWPVKKIAKFVNSVNWQARILSRILPALALVIAISFYTAGIITFGVVSMLIWSAIVVGCAVVLVILMAVMSDEF
jgi:hypothetical protein